MNRMDFWLEQPKQMLSAVDSYEIILNQKDKDIFFIDAEENTNE